MPVLRGFAVKGQFQNSSICSRTRAGTNRSRMRKDQEKIAEENVQAEVLHLEGRTVPRGNKSDHGALNSDFTRASKWGNGCLLSQAPLDACRCARSHLSGPAFSSLTIRGYFLRVERGNDANARP